MPQRYVPLHLRCLQALTSKDSRQCEIIEEICSPKPTLNNRILFFSPEKISVEVTQQKHIVLKLVN